DGIRDFHVTGVQTCALPIYADHLDIYGDHESLITSFQDFVRQIAEGGHLIIHESIADKLASDMDHVQKDIYSMSRGQFFAGSIRSEERRVGKVCRYRGRVGH